MGALKRIAIIDDEHDIAFNMCEYLQSIGYECDFYTDSQALIKAVALNDYKIIFSDLRMPLLDGIEVFKKCQQLQLDVMPKFVMMSGFLDKSLIQSYYQLGFEEVVSKPFDLDDIIIIINFLLGHGDEFVELDNNYISVSIDDFILSSQNKYNLYVKVANKIVCLAQRDQPLSILRLEQLKLKSVEFIYLKKEDYLKYVDMQFALTEVAQKSKLSSIKKSRLAKNLVESVSKSSIMTNYGTENIKRAMKFFEANTLGMIENEKIFSLLNQLYTENSSISEKNSLIAILAVAIIHTWGWSSAKIQARVIMASMLADIGLRELPDLVYKKRIDFSASDAKNFESHPIRSAKILESINNFSPEVIEIIKQHHENDSGHGFPFQLAKRKLHPLSRVLIVVTEFVEQMSVQKKDDTALKVLTTLLLQKHAYSEQIIKSLYLALELPLPVHLAKLDLPNKTTFLT